MNRKLVSIVFMVTIILCLDVFNAYGYSVKDTIADKDNYGLVENKMLHHSSGKFIFVIKDPDVSSVQVYIYSSTGSSLGMVNIGLTGAYTWFDVSIGEIDNDEVVIFLIEEHKPTNYNFFIIAYRVNIVSFSASGPYTSGGINTATQFGPSKRVAYYGSVYEYENNLYVVGMCNHQVSSEGIYFLKLFVAKFAPETNAVTVSLFDDVSSGYAHPILDFYNSSILYDNYIFLVTSITGDNTPKYYKADMSAFDMEFLASYPYTGYYPESRRLKLLGGGIYSSGDINYLWFSWCYTYMNTGYRMIKITNGRSVYNGTITSANLLASGRSATIISPNLPTGATETFSYGYSQEKGIDIVYYSNIIDNEYHVSKANCTINDLYDYGDFCNYGIQSTMLADDEVDIYYYDETDLISFKPTYSFEIAESSVSGDIYVVLIVPIQVNYDITVSYTPADSPLITDTSYRFTITTYQNALPTSLKVIAFWDNSQILAGVTGSNGQKQFTFTTILRGIHTLTVKLYDWNNVLKRTESYDYIFTGEPVTGDITPDETLIVTTNQLFAIIPQLVTILLPVFIFLSVERNVIMIIIGVTVGSVIGVLAGILPLYILFVFVIIDIILMLFMLRTSGGEI